MGHSTGTSLREVRMNTDGAQRLWQCFRPLEIHPPDCPVWFAAAIPTEKLHEEYPNFPEAALPSRGRVANGRGLTKEACLSSCMGELFELASCCSWGDELLIKASINKLGTAALPPEVLVGLSPGQYRERDAWNERYSWFDWRSNSPDSSLELDWLEAMDAYSGSIAYVPADFALIGRREAGDEGAVAIADSNGCASAPHLEQAKLAAVLELIERDAVGRWWYAHHAAHEIDLTIIQTATLLYNYLLNRRRRSKLIHISSDIPISTFVAITSEPDGTDVAIGSAASVDHLKAAELALTEAIQTELSLDATRLKRTFSPAWNEWREAVNFTTPPLDRILQQRSLSPSVSTQHLKACLEACNKSGIRLYWINFTRSEKGLPPCVRFLSPDLCHMKPRFGRSRLIHSGSYGAAYSKLNPIPLLV